MRKKNLLQIANEQQVATLADLGERLSQARRQLDISLEDVAERTHIQTRLLKAIEEGRLKIYLNPSTFKALFDSTPMRSVSTVFIFPVSLPNPELPSTIELLGG